MEGISITGPKIVFVIPAFGGIPVTETVVNAWIVMAVLAAVCFILTRNLQKIPVKKTQIVAEWIVQAIDKMVVQTMGEKSLTFAPYILTLFAFSICCSLSSLFGLRPPTADLNTTLGWALITFFLIEYHGLKAKGLKGWLKGFIDPFPIMLPMNIISELANPISLSFRHFGNIAGGMVITTILYGALGALSSALLGIAIPIFDAGIPAVLSLYFDLFSSFMQAYVFCMLSMAFINMAKE